MAPKREAGAAAGGGGAPPAKKAKKKAKKEGLPPEAGDLAEAAAAAAGWRALGHSLLFKDFPAAGGGRGPGAGGAAKLACFDFDETLVKTKSGGTVARSADDWKPWNPHVLLKLQELHDKGFRLAIFSNQGGVRGKVDGKAAQMRMERVDNFMKRAHETEVKKGGPKLTFGLLACLAVRLEDTRFRKPEPGMWDFAEARTLADGASAVEKGASFFCGDAAGRASDFSDADKGFAERAGLAFKVPEDVFGEEAGKKTVRPAAARQENFNQELCEALKALADEYFAVTKLAGEQPYDAAVVSKAPFKARALIKASSNLKAHPKAVASGKEAMALPGIGKGTAALIDEFIATGKIETPKELAKANDGPTAEQKAHAEEVAAKKQEHMSHAFL